MNKDLLLRTADAIEANPEHFDMGDWFDKSPCGTTACLAGWTIHLHRKESLDSLYKKYDKALGDLDNDKPAFDIFKDIEKQAAKILGLNSQQSTNLFYVCFWLDEEHAELYENAETNEEKAKIAAEYVRWFVETEGGTK